MSKVKKIQMPSGTTLDLPDGFDWIGTKAEYDAAWAAGTIKSDWICMITDDTADNPSRANVSLTNLDSVGEARLAEKANVDLSNLSDTGSKMMDGQWVAKTQTLSTATAVGTYTIDLSDYLPNDNYNYEVHFSISGFHNEDSNTSYGYLWSENDFGSGDYINAGAVSVDAAVITSSYYYAGHNNFILNIPGTKKYVSLAILVYPFTALIVFARAYRRLGTNN